MSRGTGDDRGRTNPEQGRDAQWDSERARAIRDERHEPVRLIWRAWERGLTGDEKERVRHLVATRGFDPHHEIRVPPTLWGMEYESRVYRPGDRELTGTIHYLNHAVAEGQWPEDVTEERYYLDVEAIVLDPDSRMFVSRFLDGQTGELRAQLGIIGETDPQMRGPEGQRQMLVEYRLDTNHIATGFQLRDGVSRVLRQEREGRRRDLRWIP